MSHTQQEQPTLPFDTRRAAHARATLRKQEVYERLLTFARNRGRLGFTANEATSEWESFANHVAPRCAELVGPAGWSEPSAVAALAAVAGPAYWFCRSSPDG
jgi:hypothetical protein